jgi:hypothetical protein
MSSDPGEDGRDTGKLVRVRERPREQRDPVSSRAAGNDAVDTHKLTPMN